MAYVGLVWKDVSKRHRMENIKYKDKVTNLWEHKLQISKYKTTTRKNYEKSNEIKKREE